MLERDIERRFVCWVESLGGLACKLVLLGQRGFPDRTVLLPGGRVVFVELKRRRGKPSAGQRLWVERLVALGFKCDIVYSLEEAQQLVRSVFPNH